MRTQPPLHLPVQGHTTVVAALLGGGADAGARDAAQGTALYCCASGGHIEIARMLVEAGCPPSACVIAGQQAIHFASQNNHPAFVEWLLDQEVAVDPRTSQGKCTPLHYACMRGSVEAAAVLLRRGADPNAADVDGQSCLSYAASAGSLKLVRLLLQHFPGLDVNAPDNCPVATTQLRR